jgi:Nse4 C-terminal
VTTFLGPLRREVKQRKEQAPKKAKERLEETQADQIEQAEEDEDEATNERVGQLQKTILTLSNRDSSSSSSSSSQSTTGDVGEPVDMIRLLVDPKDLVQTVENLFDFTFLIKEKIMLVRKDESGKLSRHGTCVDSS